MNTHSLNAIAHRKKIVGVDIEPKICLCSAEIELSEVDAAQVATDDVCGGCHSGR